MVPIPATTCFSKSGFNQIKSLFRLAARLVDELLKRFAQRGHRVAQELLEVTALHRQRARADLAGEPDVNLRHKFGQPDAGKALAKGRVIHVVDCHRVAKHLTQRHGESS